MCVYFIGTAVAIIGWKPPKKDGKKSAGNKPQVKQSNTHLTTPGLTTPEDSLRASLNYDIRPKETITSRRKKGMIKKLQEKTSLILGIVSFVIIAASFALMNMYFQIGCDFSRVSTTLNALWLTFTKIIFTTAVMVMLIQICKTNERIPKAIANNSVIQLISNLGFSMYGWHYVILWYSIACAETYAGFADYFLIGCFFWVFFFTFLIALWTSLIIENP